VAPASGDGEVATAHPLRLGFGECDSNARQQAVVRARVRSTVGLGGLGRRRERAEGVLACGGGNGGR
jgi:hypothetical protein